MIEGIKETKGKLRWTLLPFDALESVVRVLMYGAEKYADNNWKFVDKELYKDAVMRHYTKYLAGEMINPENNEPHLSSVVCDALFLLWHETCNNKLTKEKNNAS